LNLSVALKIFLDGDMAALDDPEPFSSNSISRCLVFKRRRP
jgi:hypothetical protein